MSTDPIRADVQRLHDSGLIVILEEDPIKGYRYQMGPLVRQWWADSGKTPAEILAWIVELEAQGLTSKQILAKLFSKAKSTE